MCKFIRKSTIIIITICFIVLGLVGCGNSEKNERDIIQDLNNIQIVTEYDYSITEVKIIKRNTQKKQSDNVFISIEMENSVTKVNGELELLYNYYSTGGWILDDVMVINDFEYSPLKGCDDWNVQLPLYSCGFNNYKIIEHDTDLDEYNDFITVELLDTNNVYSISGTAMLGFYYDTYNGEWVFNRIDFSDDFSLTWEAVGTYIYQSDLANYLSFHTLYYFDGIYNGLLYGKIFNIDTSALLEHNTTSKEWKDVTWEINLEEQKIYRTDTGEYFCFDEEGIFINNSDYYAKISDGCVNPAEYAEKRNWSYYGKDIPGAPLLENE